MQAIWAKGTQLQRKNPVTLLFQTIPGVRDIDGPNDLTDWVDTTHHSSPGDYEEGIPTIQRSGQVTFPLVYDPSEPLHQSLVADKQAKAKRGFKHVLTDAGATELIYDGFVLGIGWQQPVANVLGFNTTIKPSGQLTIVY
ncbi:MAG TPA: phage tail tube protein [Candidatus Acidoferrales bacterium]|nr:phage tail tube protein [Candidatus Acidoferrales bacterium]